MPPLRWASATTCMARVDLPDDSGPKISTTRPRGRPPMPRARSSASAPVGMASMSMWRFSPIRMIEPLPNCFSIWPEGHVECLVTLHRPSLSTTHAAGRCAGRIRTVRPRCIAGTAPSDAPHTTSGTSTSVVANVCSMVDRRPMCATTGRPSVLPGREALFDLACLDGRQWGLWLVTGDGLVAPAWGDVGVGGPGGRRRRGVVRHRPGPSSVIPWALPLVLGVGLLVWGSRARRLVGEEAD